MARPASRYPTELELQILKILWRQGPLDGRQLRNALAAGQGHMARDLAHTSVLTILNIMVRKKYVRRIKHDRSHRYHPRIGEQLVRRDMLRDLVARVFDGSASAVVQDLLRNADIDEQEVRRVRQIIDARSRETT